MKIETVGSFTRMGDFATMNRIVKVRVLHEKDFHLQINEIGSLYWETVESFSVQAEARQAMTLLLQKLGKE